MVNRNNYLTIYTVLGLLCLFSLRLNAQATFKEPSVPTPNAAALGKYTDIPVSNHTGVPNISIPIHNVSEGPLSLPVSISYHSSGVKVDEVSSNVGLGWNLSAGGAITRSTMGICDEYSGGLWQNGYDNLVFNNVTCNDYPNFNGRLLVYSSTYNCWKRLPVSTDPCLYYGSVNPMAQVNCKDAYEQIELGNLDTEPDIYSFNFGGYSGKFVFDGKGLSGSNASVRIVPQQDLIIKPYYTNTGTIGKQTFKYWIIVTPDGSKYYFGNTPTTSPEAIERGTVGGNETSTTWYLVKAESEDTRYTIDLTYDSENYSYWTVGSQSVVGSTATSGGVTGQSGPFNTVNVVESKKIKKITTGTRSIELNFNAETTPRTDLPSTVTYALGSIDVVFPDNTNICKRFELGHSYFTSPANTTRVFSSGSDDRYRLKLTSIQEKSCLTSGQLTVPPHVFSYNETGTIARRASLARDPWGYYNGMDNNNGLLPVSDPSAGIANLVVPSIAGDRRVDTAKMKYWVLEKIQYPTGGFTEFEYESHKADNKDVGGLRAKTINFKNSDGTLVTRKNYSYNGGSLYSGSHKGYDIIDINNKILYPQRPEGGCNWGFLIISDNRPALNSTQGYHVGYSQVTVSDLNNTSTRYWYTNLSPAPYNQYYPYAPSQTTIGMGELSLEEKLNSSGSVVAKSEYFYETASPIEVKARKTTAISPYFCNSCPNSNYDCFSGNKYYVYNPYFIKTGRYRLISKKETVDNMVSETFYTYNAQNEHGNPIQTRVVNSDGKESISKTYFAADIATDHPNFYNYKQYFTNRNMVGIPLEVKQYYNGILLGGSTVEYASFGTTAGGYELLYPSKYHAIYKNNVRDVKATIGSYSALGQPQKVTNSGFTVSNYFAWNKYQLLSKSIKASDAGADLMRWKYEYRYGTPFVETMTDENGLLKRFFYDNLWRLQTLNDRFKPDGTDIQATATTAYQYKDANNPYNFIQSTATFKSVAAAQISKQFMDGLGRPIMSVRTNGDNTYTKTYTTYDALGRPDKTFEPISSNTEGVDANYLTTVLASKAYTQPTYELSPLSRPTAQRNLDGTFVYMAYGTNTATEVLKFSVTSNANIDADDAVAANGSYAANELSKTTITNENGKITQVFKDKMGRVVLTRKFLNGTNVDTYNVYDDYGQLVMVIPPDAINASNVIKLSLVFCYKYDNQNRLCRKQVPGAEPQKFYYDNRDLLTLTQDGNMRAASTAKYLATQYDELGRVLRTGFVTTTIPLTFASSGFTIPDADRLTETQYYKRDTTTGLISATGTLATSWVKNQGARVLKPTGVTTERDFVWSYIERRAGYEYTGNPIWTGKQHILSKTYRYGNTLIGEEPINDNDYGGVDWRVSNYDGAQKPTLTNHYLYSGPSSNDRSQEVREFIRYDYDALQRLTNVRYDYSRLGSNPVEPTFVLSNSVYNFKDQLVEKNIGKGASGKFLQSIDYDYNVRGWLTGINNFSFSNQYAQSQQILTPQSTHRGTIANLAISPFIKQALTAPPVITDDNPDLFSQNIYYDNQYIDSGFPNTPQSNGNISATIWKVNGRNPQAYSYTYDDLDRLSEAKYYDVNYSYSGTPSFSTDFKYNEKLTYDKRGNILTLQRNGLNGGTFTSNGYTGATYGMIDNLTYSINDKNQLTKIMDASLTYKGYRASNWNITQYTYDANGNLKTDINKNITNIIYNYLNLPEKIEIEEGLYVITFIYDATGVKLRKIVTSYEVPEESYTIDYVNGVEYKNNVLQRIANTEGAVTKNVSGVFEYEYVLRDHLGNTRATFSDVNNDGIVSSADIKQINHYYPFGLNMEGNWTPKGANGEGNKYQFNGKEWNDDFGLGWNDYGRRFYDATIGRFSVKDRFSEKYTALSTYNYAANNPIKYLDVNGDSIDVTLMDRFDKANGKSTLNTLMSDLSAQSGLQIIAIDVDGKDGKKHKMLDYKKDKNGNAIVREGGSKKASKILTDAISNTSQTAIVTTSNKWMNSKAVGNNVMLSNKGIENFIAGVNNLDSRTMGWGMTFIHELLHTPTGGGLTDEKENEFGNPGPVESIMNEIRQELNSSGGNYGQRMSYKGMQPGGYGPAFVPFDSQSLHDLKEFNKPDSDSKFVKY